MQGQKEARRPGAKGKLQLVQESAPGGNLQVPHSSKHPQKEWDHSRLPSELRGKLWGLVWDATCIPTCPYMNLSVLSNDGRVEGNRQWAERSWPLSTVVNGRAESGWCVGARRVLGASPFERFLDENPILPWCLSFSDGLREADRASPCKSGTFRTNLVFRDQMQPLPTGRCR